MTLQKNKSLQQQQQQHKPGTDTASTESSSVVVVEKSSSSALQITMDHDQGIDMTLVTRISCSSRHIGMKAFGIVFF